FAYLQTSVFILQIFLAICSNEVYNSKYGNTLYTCSAFYTTKLIFRLGKNKFD
ncbi:hypothetical protein MNBD_BACTEROID07-2073, partial [hydrothermal vent metagenome]